MVELPTVFVSHAPPDKELADRIYDRLAQAGLNPWMASRDVRIGASISDAVRDALDESKVAVVLVSESVADSDARDQLQDELQRFLRLQSAKRGDFKIAPVLIGAASPPTELMEIQGVRLECDSEESIEQGLRRLVDGVRALIERRTGLEAKVGAKNLYVSRVLLKNIRCFESLQVDLLNDAGPVLSTLILGENAAGKSTVLRSIALGLCPESDSVALMKELPGALIRAGASYGEITIHLSDDRGNDALQVTTKIVQGSTPGAEIVRQTTHTQQSFPWGDIFVCGYGTHRSALGTASYERYSPRAAVGTLFNDQADLQNPELVMLRRPAHIRRRMEDVVLRLLMLDAPDHEILRGKEGLELHGPWGLLPLQTLSDGYRSTTQWILDYLGWLLFADRLTHSGQLGGILLIDEVEQHLHPRWQRHLLQRLREQLPGTQIIGTTHTPLTASGISDLDRARLVRLDRSAEGSISVTNVPPESLTGLRADQVLSDAFGLMSSKSPGSLNKLERYAELLSKQRTGEEDEELARLQLELADSLGLGSNRIERKAAAAVSRALDDLIAEGARDLLDVEARMQLRALLEQEHSS